MTPEELLQNLRYTAEKHKKEGRLVLTGETNVCAMAHDCISTVETMIAQINFLWGLLDDIDAVGDMVKDNDRVYRNIVEKIHPKRTQVAESDGYKIFIKENFTVEKRAANGCEAPFLDA